jgi:hypothetical protein
MQRILPKLTVDLSTNCWLFTGCTTFNGYGQIFVPGVHMARAHVIVYERVRGQIPEGHHLHHECKNRNCVNPWHVTPMTQAEHNRLHMVKGKPEYCPAGHEMTSDNTTTVIRKTGRSAGATSYFCRTCSRDKQKRNREERGDIINAQRRARYAARHKA